MKMRELEQRTGVHRETIRVYLRHGLLPEPARQGRNVADYDESHVDCILAIRRLQKEEGLTLPRIKAVLAGEPGEAGLAPGALPHLEALVSRRLDHFDATVPLSAVKSRNPRALPDAEALEKIGAVTLERRGKRVFVSRTDAELVGIWGAMRAAGFTEARGFTPDILRYYVEVAEDLARREVETFLRIVTGQLDEDEAARLALEALDRMLPFFGLLRTKAVRQALRATDAGLRPPAAR